MAQDPKGEELLKSTHIRRSGGWRMRGREESQ